MKHAKFRKTTLLLAGLAVALAACFPGDSWVSTAHAQQAGHSAGAVHGGNQGITPGGASGVPNPSPGGGPTSLGEPQSSAGPRTSENNRPGYLGGYVAPDDGGTGDESPGLVITDDATEPAESTTETTAATTESATATNTQAAVGGQRKMVCEDIRGSLRNPRHRMTGVNGERIERAGTMVHPDIDDAREVQMLRLLIASFQEEMQKRQPDSLLAGTYLGVAADIPVTEEMVMQLSESLCVPAQRSQAASIAGVAETQRQKLISERNR